MPIQGIEIHRKKSRRRLFFAVILVMSLFAAAQSSATACAQEEPTIAREDDAGDQAKTRVLEIPKGSYVEVHMANGREIEGLLGEVQSDGFMLQTVRKNRLTNRLVRFEEMQSVAPRGGLASHGGNVELTLDHGNMVVGVATSGVNVNLVFRTPPKVARNLAAHVTVTPKNK
ncbi:MAG: hypothetical protein ACM3NO_05585 [Deltaproteobacteria bacterium]